MKTPTLWFAILVALLSQTGRSQESSPLQQQRISLAELLNEDGGLKKEARPAGSVDANGFRMVLGKNGSPRFVREDETARPNTLSKTAPNNWLASDPDDIYWDDRFLMPGASGTVFAAAFDQQGRLYVGCDVIGIADLASANNIAMWDGSTWSVLGSGINGTVKAIAITEDGVLYAGGYFTSAGGVSANYVAKWDGSSWSALGSGVNRAVATIAISSDGLLYVGGYFTTSGALTLNRIGKWNGTSWSAVGSGMDGEVLALAFTDDGMLYAGGSFQAAGSVAAKNIAKWDGTTWSAMGGGLDSTVRTLHIADDTMLYAGGNFKVAGDDTAKAVARWDGTSWSSLGSGMSGGSNEIVLSLKSGNDGTLIAAGSFYYADGALVNSIAKWDGHSWISLGVGINNPVYAIATRSDGLLIAGGSFSTAGGIGASNIAKWNGSMWSAFGTGINWTVYTLCLAENNDLYIGGSFITADGIGANRVARWDGSNWFALGSGMEREWYAIDALAVTKENLLYASGGFYTIGGISANHIAQWNGTTWTAVGGGLNYSAYALALDSNGILYAGGYFTTAGGISANHIAKWDGISWSALGTGLNGSVYDLAIGADGSLYAGGSFTTAGGIPANSVAKWDGSNWSALGNGITGGTVTALAFSKDASLYVGGNFTAAGGAPASGIAKWNGSSWSTLGSGMNWYGVSVLAVSQDGTLYAGGEFSLAGGVAASRIAKWDGSSWSALGSGLNDPVYSLAISPNGALYAGGMFTEAGSKVSGYLAIWHKDEHAIPPPWTVVNTGKNATIAVPVAINPTLDGVALQSGDAVGAFYLRENIPVCGGYCIWTTGQSGVITVYGDDELTTVKDGFTEGELIHYRIWDATSGAEWDAQVTYQMGGPNYTTNGIMALASIAGFSYLTQDIVLPTGWSMISSYLSPQEPLLSTMMAGISGQMTLMKNGAGQVYWPAFGINNIGSWNSRHGYQIHMQSAQTLSITGTPVQPESTPIALIQGWNIAAYLRTSAMPVQTALAGISGDMILAKNGAGQVYWPAFGINTIGSMQPGQGYQMYLTRAATLTYPSNSLLKDAPANGVVPQVCRHYAGGPSRTGSNGIILWRGLPFADGDEVAVLDNCGEAVGNGVVRNNQVLLVVWGDDIVTERKDGAFKDEKLSLRYWSGSEDLEIEVAAAQIVNATTGQQLSGGIRYAQDIALVLEGVQGIENTLPVEYELAQNYPNPFNPATEIRFSQPEKERVRLVIYNIKGECVRRLLDKTTVAGTHTLIWDGLDDHGRMMSGGIYFLKMSCLAYSKVIKMSLIK